MRLLHKDRNTESIGHDGVEYERDEHGAFELPHELAESLLERFPHIWEAAPDPAPAEPVKSRRGAKVKPEPKQSDDEDPQDEPPAPDGDVEQTEDADSKDVAPAAKPGARKTTAAAK